jgi:hypothetical protein
MSPSPEKKPDDELGAVATPVFAIPPVSGLPPKGFAVAGGVVPPREPPTALPSPGSIFKDGAVVVAGGVVVVGFAGAWSGGVKPIVTHHGGHCVQQLQPHS